MSLFVRCTLFVCFCLLFPLQTFALSFSMTNSPLQDFTSWVAQATGYKIIVPESVNIPVSVSVDEITKDEIWPFYTAVLASNNLMVESKDGFFYVTKGQQLVGQPRPCDQVNTSIPRIVERSEVYQLSMVPVDRVLSALQSVVGAYDVVQPGGKVTALPAGRAFHLYAVDAVHDQVKALLPLLDVSTSRVLVEALVFEVSEDRQKDVGVSLKAALDLFSSAVSLASNFAVAAPIGGRVSLTTADFSALVTALESVDFVRVLSMPRLLVNSGESGVVMAGQNVPFVTGQTVGNAGDTKTPFQTIERQDVGVSLSITPRVISSQLVDLVISQESSRVSAMVKASDVVTDTRKISTRLNLVPGEWVSLGGLVSDQSGSSSAGIPGLMTLPYIGHLFRFDQESTSRKNLAVLLRVSLS